MPIIDEDGFEVAGDVRAIEMPGLAAMHTLFVREHNRVCDIIIAAHPEENEDYYFENARRIVIAEMQNIVYGEYLPTILGVDFMKSYDLIVAEETKYDPNVDSSIFNAFATAAFR